MSGDVFVPCDGCDYREINCDWCDYKNLLNKSDTQDPRMILVDNEPESGYTKCGNCCGVGYFGLSTDCRVCNGTGRIKQNKERIDDKD